MIEVKLQVGAVLFDMDGTLVDSTAAVVGAWAVFARTYPGLDVETILQSNGLTSIPLFLLPSSDAGSHGVRTIDNLAKWCGITDPELLVNEVGRFERAIIESAGNGIKMLPGVHSILENLSIAEGIPNQRWTICTSATRVYATIALNAASINAPGNIVTADDVCNGKPHPEPYLAGAARCGVEATDCVVVEDAPTGVVSGLAAGSRVIGLLTTHSREQMLKAAESAPEGHFYLVPDLSSVAMALTHNGLGVEITLTMS